MITQSCRACGKDFTKPFSGGRVYCSEACRKLVYPIQEKSCEICHAAIFRLRQYTQEMWDRKKTCSKKCRGIAQRKTMEMPCAYCGVMIRGNPSRFLHERGTKRYCSKECGWHAAERSGEEIFLAVSPLRNFNDQRRDELYGTKCVLCGFDRFIEYAHIIPRREGGTIHPDNMLVLCPNHHRLFDGGALDEEEESKLAEKLIAARNNPLSVNLGCWPKRKTRVSD